jgi:hypothetical protein
MKAKCIEDVTTCVFVFLIVKWIVTHTLYSKSAILQYVPEEFLKCDHCKQNKDKCSLII